MISNFFAAAFMMICVAFVIFSGIANLLIFKYDPINIMEMVKWSFIGVVGLEALAPVFAGLLEILDIGDRKFSLKKYNALQSQLEYLKEKEKVEVAKLEQMKQELVKQPIVKTEVSTDKRVDLEQLKQLRAELEKELDIVYDENYKKPEQGKQKVLG